MQQNHMFKLNSGRLITQDSADNFCSISLKCSSALWRCSTLPGKVKVFIHIFPSSQNSFHSIPIKLLVQHGDKLNFFFRHSKMVLVLVQCIALTPFSNFNSVNKQLFPSSLSWMATHGPCDMAEHCNVTTICGRVKKDNIQVLRSIYCNVSRIKRVF